MKWNFVLKFLPIYALVIILLLTMAMLGNYTITTLAENTFADRKYCVIIDAGHGGVDGGTTSCTGILEKNINLDIAVKLNEILKLMGYRTKMIRTTDESIYTEGNSIAGKKASDLKNRVKIVNETPNAILVSIHQNYFEADKYKGAQVFYNTVEDSKNVATQLQNNFVKYINPGSKRLPKKADGVYLMQNTNCTSVLIECGFLSNHEEEALLRDGDYQNKLCSVIAATLSKYIEAKGIS